MLYRLTLIPYCEMKVTLNNDIKMQYPDKIITEPYITMTNADIKCNVSHIMLYPVITLFCNVVQSLRLSYNSLVLRHC